MHPIQDVIQALLQSHICHMLAGLVMIIEALPECALVRLQAIGHLNAGLLVAMMMELSRTLSRMQ
jgi:hypothetical protein